jgi:ABC-type dipeptide/oligopeptide/nickel transport system permease subunit
MASEADAPRLSTVWQSPTVRLMRRFYRDPKAIIATCLLVLFVVLAVGAPLVAPYGEAEQILEDRLVGPSLEHPMGTDRLGRDLFSRVIYGTRASVSVGLVAVAVGCLIGVPLGLVCGYLGGWLDEIAMRFVDAWIAFPNLILVMSLVAILGAGISKVMLAIGLLAFPVFARLVRAQTLSAKAQDYVLAARSLGATNTRLLIFHLLPNTIQPVIVQASLLAGTAVLAEAGLSFLGVGIKPPKATWGVVIQEGFQIIRVNPWAAITPGILLTLFALMTSLLGDRLRDVLDPRLRGSR